MSVVSSTWEHIPDVVKGSNIGYVDKLRKGRNFSSALIESFMTHKHQLEPAVTWLIPQKIPRRFRIIKKMVLIKYKFWCRSIVTKWMQSIAGKQKVSELWRSVVLTKLRQIKNVIHVHHRKKKHGHLFTHDLGLLRSCNFLSSVTLYSFFGSLHVDIHKH